jgi:hypothetical protein
MKGIIMKCQVVIVKTFNVEFGALVVKSLTNGSDITIDPSSRVITYKEGNVVNFSSKKAATGFCKTHGDNVRLIT